MDKNLITKEFNKIYSYAENEISKGKGYKNVSDLLVDVLGQSFITIENILITLNNEIEELKKLT